MKPATVVRRLARIAAFASDGVAIVVSLAMLAAIRGYRVAISPWLPRSCRYQPTCSAYAAQAVRRHGPIRGGWKAVSRIARCHPWSQGGWDPP